MLKEILYVPVGRKGNKCTCLDACILWCNGSIVAVNCPRGPGFDSLAGQHFFLSFLIKSNRNIIYYIYILRNPKHSFVGPVPVQYEDLYCGV